MVANLRAFAIATSLTLISGCGSESGGSAPDSTGELTLGLTDAPLESATRVVVAFTGVQLKPAGDAPPLDPIVFEETSCNDFDASTGTCSIDLLELTGATRKVVFNGNIPAGNYVWVRLMVDADPNEMDSYIELDDGGMCPIWVPSGDETGLKIVSGITVTANGVSDYTLDFDVRSSITVPPGLQFLSAEACNQNYILKPAIRIVDTTQTGTIAGSVSETFMDDSESCVRDESSSLYETAAVYVFENFDGTAVTDDIDTSDNPNPITTASVVYDASTGTYEYEAAFLLAPEDYLVALTCTAGVDMPDSDEFDPTRGTSQDFEFVAEQVVTTVVDQTVVASF
jgi:hypothetical protein